MVSHYTEIFFESPLNKKSRLMAALTYLINIFILLKPLHFALLP